jgi:hypothetical protein
MKRILTLSLLLTASLASATPSDADAKGVVETLLVAPLVRQEQKHSRFSRAYLPPQVRRVRVLGERALTDARGAAFFEFAIDAHHGYGPRPPPEDSKSWRKDVIVGCVYPESDEVFIKRGETFFGSELLLGKKSNAPAGVCRTAGGQVAAAR